LTPNQTKQGLEGDLGQDCKPGPAGTDSLVLALILAAML
jgi:hypothetical protein